MNKRWLISIAVLACCTAAACGQATVGSLDVRVGVSLPSPVNRGAEGILVRAHDVAVKGSEGKSLRFVAAAYQQGNDNVPTDYLDAKATRDVSTWETLELELPYSSLLAAFGKGSRSIFVIFYILDLGGLTQTIPGSYLVRPVTIDLQGGQLGDRREADQRSNEAVIRSKFERGSQYRALLEVAAAYDLTVVVRQLTMGTKATRTHYSWEVLADGDDGILDRYVQVLVREWVKLPVDFVKKTGLRGVVFVKNLTYDGVKVGGGFDVDDRLIICAVEGSFGDENIQHALFHEYMHVIDNLLCCRDHFDNAAWNGLNHPDATYSDKGALDMIREDFAQIAQDHPAPGFLNGYCRADIYQDKAEVFSYLLVGPYYRRAESWLSQDVHLARKFEFMKRALRALSPSFTEEYFARIHR